MAYRHRQPGFVTISLFIITFLFLLDLLALSVIFWSDNVPSYVNPLLIALIVVTVLLAILFSTMTVIVDEQKLSWYFGPGFWKKSIELAQIKSVESVKNRWWYGWGIRYVQKGWLYNVSGLQAVEVMLENGRHFRLGTDEQEKLVAALESAKP